MNAPSMQHVDSWAWAQECSRRARSAGIGFRFDETAQTPYTDGKTVVVPPLPANASREDFTILRGAVIHECGHITRPEAFRILERERLKTGSPLWACMNIVEDAAQEREIANTYRGDRKSLADMHAAIVRRQIAHACKEGAVEGPPEQLETSKKLMAGVATSLVSASDWSTDMKAVFGDYVRAMDKQVPGVADLAADLVREGFADKIKTAGDPKGAWKVARALYARLFPDTPEEENKNPKNGDSGEDGEGDAASDGERDPANGADGKPKDGDGKGKPVSAFRIPWELLMHSDHAQKLTKGHPLPSSINWDGKPDGGRPTMYTSQQVRDIRPDHAATSAAMAMRFPNELVQEVRLLLQARARTRWAHEKLAGRLDRRNLGRVLMPLVGDGTYNRSVFIQRAPKLALDVALTVLVDSSGSMSGAKYATCAIAATSLYDLAQVALRIPVEVLGFTYCGAEPVYYEFKSFGQRRMDRILLAAKLRHVGDNRMLYGNADGDALLWAGDRLRKRREARRVMIVLSDGCPADAAAWGDSDFNLKYAIQGLRKTPGVEVYGIGIMDANVRRYYSPTAPVIKSPEEVPAALITVLKDVLQRRA